MEKMNKSLLTSLVLAIFLSGSTDSYGSDVQEEELNVQPTNIVQPDNNTQSSWSIWDYMPWNWGSSKTLTEPEELESVTTAVNSFTEGEFSELVEEMLAKNNDDDLAHPIAAPDLTVSVYNLVGRHISLGSHFERNDLICEGVSLGENTVSIYDGATYRIKSEGKNKYKDFSGYDLSNAVEHKAWPKDVVLISVKKGDMIIYKRNN